MKKVLLFDFAGVIGSESYFGWLKTHIPNFSERKAEFQKIADQGDLGLVTPDEFFSLISQVTQIPVSAVWQEIYEPVQINSELVSFIQELKKNHTLVLFSNYLGVLLRRILEKHHLTDLFDDIFISSEQQVKKPDEAAFLKVIEHLHCQKSDIIFIDDRSENISAGQKMGIDSILFTTVKQLALDLQDREL